MANMKKFDKNATIFILRHHERSLPNSSNTDINFDKTIQNYNLMPNRGYSYLKQRLDNVYIYGQGKGSRKTVYSVGWICTAPDSLHPKDIKRFFELTVAFLNNRYGYKNCLGAYVHMDESRPHLHYMFTPIVWDKKNNREKLCVSDLMNKKELSSFHDDWQKYLYANQLNVRVVSQNKNDRLRAKDNRSVWDMKKEYEQKHKFSYERTF